MIGSGLEFNGRSIDPCRWLEQGGFQVIGRTADDLALDPYNRLTSDLGDHPDMFRPMLRAIKHGINGKPHPLCLDLSTLAPGDVELILRFGCEAYRSGLLAYFHHDKRCWRVRFRLQDDPLVVGFFTGTWFEKYVLERVVRGLSSLGAADDTPVLTRTQVRLPDGQDFEIDILIGTRDRVLFFECKSGNNLAANLLRYRSFVRKHLGLSAEHAGLVVLERLAPDQKLNLEYLSGMTVVNLDELDQFLRRAFIGEDHAA
jgi:hypothetical protein